MGNNIKMDLKERGWGLE